jgi:hypothetical protein
MNAAKLKARYGTLFYGIGVTTPWRPGGNRLVSQSWSLGDYVIEFRCDRLCLAMARNGMGVDLKYPSGLPNNAGIYFVTGETFSSAEKKLAEISKQLCQYLEIASRG